MAWCEPAARRLPSSAGWGGQRLTYILDAAGGALLGNWLTTLLGRLH